MSKTHYLPAYVKQNAKVMVFIDGENLAIRYGNVI